VKLMPLQLKIYLASPFGFSESTRGFMENLEEQISSLNYEVLNPWRITSPEEFKWINDIKNLQLMKEKFSELNFKIGQKNEHAINDSDVILAILDGTDVDSGTASEIGYACAKNKKIFGYRNDSRLAGENYGSKINIQVEYWIKKSGGKIFQDLNELLVFFKEYHERS
jgi:nucleoside 2-deoxyribosyltransferase